MGGTQKVEKAAFNIESARQIGQRRTTIPGSTTQSMCVCVYVSRYRYKSAASKLTSAAIGSRSDRIDRQEREREGGGEGVSKKTNDK